MSKQRKGPAGRPAASSTISEMDIKFEKILQFAGFIFLSFIGIFFGSWLLFDYALNLTEFAIGPIDYAYLVYGAVSAAFSFSLAAKIKKDRDEKKKIFFDWLISQSFLCMFAIFSVAIFQW